MFETPVNKCRYEAECARYEGRCFECPIKSEKESGYEKTRVKEITKAGDVWRSWMEY